MRHPSRTLACLFLLLAATACARPPAAGSAVTGTLQSGDAHFPPGSRAVLEIRETSSSRRTLLAEATLDLGPGWEIAGTRQNVGFSVAFDPKRLEPSRAYVLYGRILKDGARVGETQPVAVLTGGAPSTGIVLIAGGAPSEGDSSVSATGNGWLDVEPPAPGIGVPTGTSATTPSAP